MFEKATDTAFQNSQKVERQVIKMAKGMKKPQKLTPYQRNLQIAVIVISVLLVLSLVLSAINI